MLKRIHLPLSTYNVIGLIFGIYAINLDLIWLYCCLLLITIAFVKKQWSLKIFSALLFGTVVDYNKIDNSAFKYCLIINAASFSNQNKQINTDKLIAIYTKTFVPICIGEQILFKNLGFNFSGDHIFENYLIKNQLAANVFASELIFEKIKEAPITSLAKYKRTLLKKINYTMSNHTKIMFNSIFLGYKPECKNEMLQLKNEFQTWGIVHYLARSGLHLVIISTIWQTIGAILTVPIIYSNLITLFFMLLFYLLTWSGLPFIRALIMIAGYRICHFLELQVHLLHLLNLSCIAILVHNPIAIFFLDFQLSFLLTYGLIFFNEITRAQKTTPKKSIDYKK